MLLMHKFGLLSCAFYLFFFWIDGLSKCGARTQGVFFSLLRPLQPLKAPRKSIIRKSMIKKVPSMPPIIVEKEAPCKFQKSRFRSFEAKYLRRFPPQVFFFPTGPGNLEIWKFGNSGNLEIWKSGFWLEMRDPLTCKKVHQDGN